MLSVVIPAYNERRRLPAYLEEWRALELRIDGGLEIVVVDDGSSDGTGEWVEEQARDWPTLRLERNERNSGKAITIANGMKAARGEARLFADADGATPAREALRLLRHFDPERAPVVIGSRIALSNITQVERRLGRHYAGRIFATLVSLISGLSFYDTQCGFKMLSARAVDVIFPLMQCRGWAFDVELLMLALKHDLAVAEVPVSWREIPGSKVKMSSAAPKMLLEVWRISRRLGRAPRHNALAVPDAAEN